MSNDIEVRSGIEERLMALISIPTVSAEREERAEAFDAFPRRLAELYPRIHAQLERRVIDNTGLLFRWAGASPASPLVLMAHWDVVPASDWDAGDPFTGRIVREADGDWVVGRGTLDDKGPLVVLLDAVENLLAAGFQPAHDIFLVLGGDEEVMGSNALAISDVLREELRDNEPYLVLDEGGAVTSDVMDFVQSCCAMIGLAEKGLLTVRLEVRGDGGHASSPRGDEPIPRLVRALRSIEKNPMPARLTSSVRAMLRALPPVSSPAAAALLGLANRVAPLTATALASVSNESAALVRTSVAPTRLSAGDANNVLAGHASATLNCRILPGATVETTLAAIRRRIRDDRVTLTVVEGHNPSPESPVGDRFAAIATALQDSWPEATAIPYLLMAATDSRHFHSWCRHVYRFAPLEMSAEQRATIHGDNERVSVDSLVRGERFHRALITARGGTAGGNTAVGETSDA